jgi:thioredoxin 1
MLSRRSLLATIAALGFVVPALAAAPVDYSPAAFDAALKSGKPVLVWIHASWCPTCKAQAPTLAKIEADPQYKDLTVVRVDFDSQKDAVKRFGARMQSTLITFKDGKETGRSVGETDPAAVTALVAKAI